MQTPPPHPQPLYDQKVIYSNFIDSLKSPKTKEKYAYFLKSFMQFHRIEKEDYAALFADPDQKIKDYLIAASKRDLSKSHFCIMISALKNFYQMNDFDDIKWNKLKRFI